MPMTGDLQIPGQPATATLVPNNIKTNFYGENMMQNYRTLLLIIGIAVVLYAFLTLQFLLGIIAVVIITIAILTLPLVEQCIKSR